VRKFITIAAAAGLFSAAPLAAQTTDQSAVILPLEAQTCNLPVAPARIPEEASYEDLAKAKSNVVSFQSAMMAYRECLEAANVNQSKNLTDGNMLAINNAHNYSVEMEERIAEQFNIAVRAYKARQAEK
jgi:hypothetical protein